MPRLAVIGGGILGLAHAYLAAKRGWRVTLFERHQRATGASVRNFGQIWPIGQPAEMREIALRSRALWMQMLSDTHLPYRPTGSLHVAYRDDEIAVLEECGLGTLLSPSETADRSQAIETRGLLGA